MHCWQYYRSREKHIHSFINQARLPALGHEEPGTCIQWSQLITLLYPPAMKLKGGILDSPCSSVRPSAIGVQMILKFFSWDIYFFRYMYHLGQDLGWELI